MSKKLKEAFIAKMDVKTSPDFDSQFFKKLEKEKARKTSRLFSPNLTWLISGCATLSVLFIAINSYEAPKKAPFHHKEYVEAVIDVQNSFDDSVTNDNASDTADLTISPANEI